MDGFWVAWEAFTTTPLIFAAFGGVAWGIVGGALPGISPSIAIALLLPFTYGMDPASAIVLLASTYVGAEYGGSIPAILINTPGTNAAAATVIDGYEMKKQGRAGEALGISLMCGVVGGLVGIVLLILLAKPLAGVALLFTPPAYFALGMLGISVIATLTEGSMIKGFMAATVGLMIATVGTDPFSGVNRFTFGRPELLDGIPYLLIMIGIYALSELYTQASEPGWERPDKRIRIKLPNWAMWKRIWPATALGSGIGAFEGVMPGAGGTIASFMSYNEARRWSKHPEEFGKGSPEGIAAPEAANNTVACTALVPTLSFGIPGSNSMAILMGGLLLHGLVPGPMLFQQHADFMYALYGGLVVANFAQLVIGILIMTPCLWLVGQPKPLLTAGIYGLVFSGIYSVHNDSFDIGIALAAAVAGYALKHFKFPFLPLVLGTILGYLIESSFRRSLLVSNGDYGIFVRDPMAASMLGLAVVFVLISLGRSWYAARQEAVPE
jgi:putative tricarboxylic transport membrane protein